MSSGRWVRNCRAIIDTIKNTIIIKIRIAYIAYFSGWIVRCHLIGIWSVRAIIVCIWYAIAIYVWIARVTKKARH